MDTSSESDSYERRMRGHRPRGRESRRRSGRDRATDSGGGDDGRAADISGKISTLANTLQDTSRNLTKVDRMLGQYREHADDQAEAMTLSGEDDVSGCVYKCVSEKKGLESLEDSINQLQTPRLSRANEVRSSSASTLHTSDLEACSASGRQNVHTVHQTLRDLRCDQQRLSDDLDREILRRNRYLVVLTPLYSTQQFVHD
ncbi:hypothetical protein XENOCAPTIV_014782 [Xenoophorus captivus]|uniref:Uncharacterized protein n=1 Tax=Xenoophorus captivus TaxID=1517983 RepID=A0ABV0RCH9_9TELE